MVAAATAQTASGTAGAKPLAFEVVSVRPNTSSGSVGMTAAGDGIYLRNLTLRRIVNRAYGIVLRNLIIGLPDWADNDHFDITAKLDASDLPAFTELGIDARFQLLQSVLANRFNMQCHFETRDIPVYELVLDKNGPRFAAAEFSLAPGGEHEVGMSTAKGEIRTMGQPIDRFAQALSSQLGRPVIDKTGLTGHYAFTLRWTPDTDASPSPTDSTAPADVSGPSVFTAVQEQLGLKLQSTKAPTQVLVIDHIDRPTAN